MRVPHYAAIIVALLVGYVAARFFPQVGNAVGLP
jgi:hypothetical protein